MASLAGRSSPPRVFIDSSVLIAAAASSTGSARDLINLGLDGKVDLFVSSVVLTESQRNVARKLPRALPIFQLLRAALQHRIVDPTSQLVASVAQSIVPKDAPVVAAALAAQAEFLASYDRKHLLGQASQIQAAYQLVVATPDQIISRV